MLCGQRHHPEVRVHLPREARLPLSSTPSSHPSLPSIYVILIPIVSSGIEEPRQGYAFVWYFSVGDSSLLGCHPTGWCLSLKLSIILIYLDIFIFTINNPPPPPPLLGCWAPPHTPSFIACLSLSLSLFRCSALLQTRSAFSIAMRDLVCHAHHCLVRFPPPGLQGAGNSYKSQEDQHLGISSMDLYEDINPLL